MKAPALLLAMLCQPAWLHAMPAVGDVVSGAIPLAAGRQIPLPPGRYTVQSIVQEGTPISGQDTNRNETISIVTLVNHDPGADFPLMAVDFSLHARVNWAGQPCATQPPTPALSSEDFGTTASSLIVKCVRVFSQFKLRNVIRSVKASGNAWQRARLSAVAEQAAQFPNNGLAVTGYLSKGSGDRLNIWITLNPGAYGLDDAEGQPSLFRNLKGTDPRVEDAKRYAEAVAAWSEGYLQLVEQHFLAGRGFGDPHVRPLVATGLQRQAGWAVAAAPAPSASHTRAPASDPSPAPAPAPAPAPVPATGSGPAPAKAAVDRPRDTLVQSTAPAPQAQATSVPPTVAPPSAPAAPSAAALPQAQKIHALVIGNGAYATAQLPNPRNDATAIAERFRAFGFAVTLVLDANRTQLVKALAQFGTQARGADVGIVFYAGHGIQVGGANYLIPVDLDLSGQREVSISLDAVSLDSILSEHLPGRSKLVFLDACRDNPLARSMAYARGGAVGLAPVQTASGTLISYATRDGGTAADGSGRNSPYTSALLAHLDAPDDIALVLRRVRRQVLESTRGRQEPWEYGSLVGDALVLSNAAVRPPAPVPAGGPPAAR
jgi:hypothetical protein